MPRNVVHLKRKGFFEHSFSLKVVNIYWNIKVKNSGAKIKKLF